MTFGLFLWYITEYACYISIIAYTLLCFGIVKPRSQTSNGGSSNGSSDANSSGSDGMPDLLNKALNLLGNYVKGPNTKNNNTPASRQRR